jgi:fructose-bisphosphate aldolase class II
LSKTLAQILQRALKEGWALPHFNISNLEQLRGVCEAAKQLRAPLMVGTSEGERKFIGLSAAVALIREYRQADGIPLWLNADHTFSVEAAKRAIDAGYDSVHIDLSKKSFAENLGGTREIVKYARARNPEISVEGELGYLVTESSKVYKKVIKVDPVTFTKPDEAVRFVRETGVNRFAPAVGNLHGIAANRPKLDYNLIKKLRSSLPDSIALVLHGGSGNAPAAFRKVIDLGFSNIHISTELRLAYRDAWAKSLKAQKDEYAPYRLAEPVVEAVKKTAEKYIKIFGANNRV